MDDSDVLDLEEGSSETGIVGNLCLVGKVLNLKLLNTTAITNICIAAWKTRSPFSVTSWNNNIFLFRFEEMVLSDRPWSIMNSLMVLQPVVDGIAITDHDFSVSPLWVQIHGLPVGKMNRANAEIIGKRFQKLLAIETNPDGIMLDRSFLWVRVNINLELPIPKGFWLRTKSVLTKDLWISCKYEKLSAFCFACGRIGHDNRSCRFVPRDDGSNSGYGPDIRANGIRRSQIPIEVIRHEVDEAENCVSKLLGRRVVANSVLELSGRSFVAQESDNDARHPKHLEALERSSIIIANQQEVVGARPTCAAGMVSALQSTCGSLMEEKGMNTTNLSESFICSPSPSMGIPKYPLGLQLGSLSHFPNLPQSPGPNALHLSSAKPLYFVTEPTDSPPYHTSQPTIDHHNPNLPSFEEISPNGNPTRNQKYPTLEPPSSITSEIVSTQINHSNSSSLDKSLTTVFHKLAIKRKSTKDPIDSNRSKLLRLCAPHNLSSHTQEPKQSSSRKSVRRRGSNISAKKSFGILKICLPLNPVSVMFLSSKLLPVWRSTFLWLQVKWILIIWLMGVWLALNSHPINDCPNLELSRNWAYFDNPGFSSVVLPLCRFVVCSSVGFTRIVKVFQTMVADTQAPTQALEKAYDLEGSPKPRVA
ncbi:hypothetical protein RHSIM_Rhsim01G0198800 [Rhododendron simsii]|uniref:CCHC-type domain-containing protein n=1 Tax=Rhododendron simsii TaxID=118357 RepID=A0A834LWD5_RHOSS|nr:hypothetical protein RHSIM_Rhsim01G0198800 [Rhododendron simsii]